MECERHDGIHLFTDMTLVENVDADGQPVAPGTPGSRLLVTNLENRVQPIIRLEVADSMTFATEPCSCGRTLVKTTAVAGRSDDVLELPGAGGGTVSVPPIEFAVVARDRNVSEFQVVQEGAALTILVVAHSDGDADLAARLSTAVAQRLEAAGVDSPRVTVEQRDALPRTGGKLQIVIADRGAKAGR